MAPNPWPRETATSTGVPPMNGHLSLRFGGRLGLLLVLASIFWSIAVRGSDDLRIGQRYEIVGELYAYGVADDLNSKQLSLISLVPLKLSGPEIISQRLVPPGSILTIVDRGPRRFLAFLYPDRYIVQVTGLDAPRGVPVVIDLSRGIQGKSTSLNPEIFKPCPD